MSLADFIAPKDTDLKDYIGGFVVTTGIGLDEKVAEFEAQHDDGSQERVGIKRGISFPAYSTTHTCVCDSIGDFRRHLRAATHGGNAHESSGKGLASRD